MDTSIIPRFTCIAFLILGSCSSPNHDAQKSQSIAYMADLYRAAPADVQTRWVSPENPTGEKGKGGWLILFTSITIAV